MDVVEVVGVVTGALCVVLAVRRNIWTFPVGLANNAFFLVLFVEAGLYADAALQLVYAGLGIAGWWAWLRGGPGRTALRVTSTPRAAVGLLLAAVVAGTAVLTWVLTTWTDSTVPLADGATTALSLVAQFMLNRKWLEHWLVWIVADVIYVALYAVKDLWLTAGLYAGFIVLCVTGFRAWRTPEPATDGSDADVSGADGSGADGPAATTPLETEGATS